ncbi:hypothetical protein AMECASPLE_033433 [Ameca splendens]|uniref:Uncharacterized protein n=1 Tax=Ameca splendens TaxID=208324 RepID=A0ABV0Y6S6_9TELE
MGALISSLTWMKRGHGVNTPTSSVDPQQTDKRRQHVPTNTPHVQTATLLAQQSDMCKLPASIFHYYNPISWREGWFVFLLQLTQSLRWAVNDTRPQTRLVANAYRIDPVGSSSTEQERRAEWWSLVCIGLSCVLCR